MDPDTTLAALMESATPEQLDLLNDLGDWLARGGFLPRLWELAYTTDPNPSMRGYLREQI